jgi:hypothetical protein
MLKSGTAAPSQGWRLLFSHRSELTGTTAAPSPEYEDAVSFGWAISAQFTNNTAKP